MKTGNSKAEKIKVLKDIQAGRLDVKELLPKKFQTWYHNYKENTYENKGAKETLTEEQFQERMKSDKSNTQYIVIKYVPGIIPLAFSESDVLERDRITQS